MEIRPLDLTDPAAVHRYYEAMRAAVLADNPDRPLWSEQAMTAHVCEPTADEKVEAWIAADGSADDATVLGGSLMFLPQLDNLEKAYTAVFVPPAHGRSGIGGALVEHLVGRAAANGRTTVLSESGYSFERRDDHGYRRFAERHGFSVGSVEVTRRLQLPVADDALQGWIDAAAPYHSDYRIETFESLPDDLLASVCELSNQLAVEAPTGDIDFEAERLTPEIRRESELRDLRRGLRRSETVAIAPDGRAAATTSIGIPDDEPDRFQQWITIVRREHRGHRLGLAVKAANLRAVQRDHPGRSVIFTSNHEDNDHMVAINETMGFVPFELSVEFQRKLDG